jgi:hypothetical protein
MGCLSCHFLVSGSIVLDFRVAATNGIAPLIFGGMILGNSIMETMLNFS